MICDWNRGERIRTSDLFVPNETRYQAALHPVLAGDIAGDDDMPAGEVSRGLASVDARVGVLDGVDVDVVLDGRRIAVWAGGIEVWAVARGDAAVGIREEIVI